MNERRVGHYESSKATIRCCNSGPSHAKGEPPTAEPPEDDPTRRARYEDEEPEAQPRINDVRSEVLPSGAGLAELRPEQILIDSVYRGRSPVTPGHKYCVGCLAKGELIALLGRRLRIEPLEPQNVRRSHQQRLDAGHKGVSLGVRRLVPAEKFAPEATQ